MPDTWTTLNSTGVWDSIPPSAFLLLTEGGDRLRTESDLAILVEYSAEDWTVQSNGAAGWIVI